MSLIVIKSVWVLLCVYGLEGHLMASSPFLKIKVVIL